MPPAAPHLTQSSLSRQIRRLEQQVGARLLDRTPRGTQLSEAGRVFLPLATTLLRSTDQAAARAVARPSRITIGFGMNLMVTPAVREPRHRYPDADVRTRHGAAYGAFGTPRGRGRGTVAVPVRPVAGDGAFP